VYTIVFELAYNYYEIEREERKEKKGKPNKGV
jgi:hypothetical protein